MEEFNTIELPESHKQFARDIREAAIKNGMDEVRIKYRPPYSSRDWQHHSTEVEVVFRAKDGRGRPNDTLTIECDTKLKAEITVN